MTLAVFHSKGRPFTGSWHRSLPAEYINNELTEQIHFKVHITLRNAEYSVSYSICICACHNPHALCGIQRF